MQVGVSLKTRNWKSAQYLQGQACGKRIWISLWSGLHEVDYIDTFSPVVKLSSVRVLLALAVYECHFIHQMDVKTAFLNGLLEEDIYMEQPKALEDLHFPSHVCHFKRSLY